MRKLFGLAAILILALASEALAVDVSIHGDLNNRFNLYTNQSQFYKGSETVTSKSVLENDNTAFWGEIKYRLWTDVSTNDGAVKGVYAIELGGIRFGDRNYPKGGGGGYSGDGVNIETRWAYTDFQLPFVDNKARVSIGLQPWTVNKFVWSETIMGVMLKGDAGPAAYTLGWGRGREFYPTLGNGDAFQDADAFLARADLKPADNTKLGLVLLYQREDAADQFDPGTSFPVTNPSGSIYEIKQFGPATYDIFTIGTDGSASFGTFFVNWDAFYQGGSIDDVRTYTAANTFTSDDYDVSSYFLHADLGMNLGAIKLTYTGWYASGDDDPNDKDIENFMSTDVDIDDSIVLFEGGYTDDNYFTEAPYILNKGMILNKIAVDYKATEKTKVGGALLYLMTAEDLTLANGSKEDTLGTEIDLYVSHMLYPDVEVALNFGYLFADDGMDFFEETINQDGSSDADIYRSTMRVRYKF